MGGSEASSDVSSGTITSDSDTGVSLDSMVIWKARAAPPYAGVNTTILHVGQWKMCDTNLFPCLRLDDRKRRDVDSEVQQTDSKPDTAGNAVSTELPPDTRSVR